MRHLVQNARPRKNKELIVMQEIKNKLIKEIDNIDVLVLQLIHNMEDLGKEMLSDMIQQQKVAN